MTKIRNVAAAIIVRDGQVLVTRRAPGQQMAGLWEFPGGKMEPGETARDCVVRELLEELAIECEAGAILTSNVHRYDGGAINLIAVQVRIIAGTLRLSVHDEVRWLIPAALTTVDLAPADIPVAHVLQARPPAPWP